jgi:anti-sigma factor RsiW
MDCSEIKALLSEYIDGTLEPETKDLVDQHVASCAECREELASLKALVHELGSLEPMQPPEDFLVQVHERLEKPSLFSTLLRTLFRPFQIKLPLQIAGAVAMAILVFSLLYFQREEFRAPGVAPQEDKQADEVVGTKDRAIKTKARPALQQTALKESQKATRPIEVTILVREDLTPWAHEPSGAIESPIPSEKQQPETARRTLQSAQMKEEERSAGLGAQDKVPYKIAKEDDPLVGLNRLIRSLQGKVLSVHRDKNPRQPGTLYAQIPASRWEEFKDQLKALGDLEIPAEPRIQEGEENLQVRIRLLTQNHGQSN